MKKNLKWVGLGGVLAAVVLFAMDLPAMDSGSRGIDQVLGQEDLFRSCMFSAEKDCRTWVVQGGEMPRALPRNAKVELAADERYALSGQIEIRKGSAFLRIDLHKQPWLASRIRVKSPYYRIDGDALPWQKYAGRSVTVLGVARQRLLVDRGRTLTEIYLEAAANGAFEERL